MHKVNSYCPECDVPQQMYFCEECSKEDFFPLFCAPCFIASHLSRGHHGTLLFLPGHCSCSFDDCPACKEEEQKTQKKGQKEKGV